MMMIMMMVMVVGFAYKLGKSSDERKRNWGVGWLMSLVEKENGLERDYMREKLRKMFVFLSLTPCSCLFYFS
jgi:hypothetical protein